MRYRGLRDLTCSPIRRVGVTCILSTRDARRGGALLRSYKYDYELHVPGAKSISCHAYFCHVSAQGVSLVTGMHVTVLFFGLCTYVSSRTRIFPVPTLTRVCHSPRIGQRSQAMRSRSECRVTMTRHRYCNLRYLLHAATIEFFVFTDKLFELNAHENSGRILRRLPLVPTMIVDASESTKRTRLCPIPRVGTSAF